MFNVAFSRAFERKSLFVYNDVDRFLRVTNYRQCVCSFCSFVVTQGGWFFFFFFFLREKERTITSASCGESEKTVVIWLSLVASVYTCFSFIFFFCRIVRLLRVTAKAFFFECAKSYWRVALFIFDSEFFLFLKNILWLSRILLYK